MKKNSALIIIDVQKGLFDKKREIYNSDVLVSNINAIIDIFRREERNIVLVQHTNKSSLKKDSDNWQIHSEVKVIDSDIRMIKYRSNVLEEKNLINYLKKENITDLIIMGLVTHGCVQAACLSGKSLGFNVTLIKDGHSNFNKNAKELIVQWNEKLQSKEIMLVSTQEYVKNIEHYKSSL